MLIEYENGINLSFYINLNVLNDYCYFSVFGMIGMVEGDFVWNYFKVYDCIILGVFIDKLYIYDDLVFMYYGVEEEMVVDWIVYFENGILLLVLIVDVL